MANYKVKWHLNPINGICIALLLVVIILVSGKPDTTKPELPVKAYDDEYLLRSYQMQLTTGPNGREYVVVYDYERVVGVLPLDNKCNLTELIFKDNE